MSPKPAIVLLVGALCFAPAAYLAHRSQVRVPAFAMDRTIAAQADRVARQARPLPVVHLDTVSVLGQLHPTTAVVSDAEPSTCQPWRRLRAAPDARAARVPMVRACDAADMLDGTDAPPPQAVIPVPPRPPPPHPDTWRFTEDLGAPR